VRLDDAASHGLAPPVSEAAATRPAVRGRLFRKYVALLVVVVSVALVLDGAFEIWFSYRDHEASLIRLQREQAASAAARIGAFVTNIESQIAWTTELPWSSGTMEQRHFDALRLLRQVPAITELSQLDATGHEQLRVSRLEMDEVGSNRDYSHDPRFTVAMAHHVYYGPVYFRRGSEPYMTLAVAGSRRDAGVSVAEVNLKFIWDVVSRIKVGQHGLAFVVDGTGRLIAHPDISLVLRNTSLANLAQVRAALAEVGGGAPEEVPEARDVSGQRVLSAFASVDPLKWLVFVELPVSEAYAPLYASIERAGVLLAACLVLAFFAGLFLARRMVGPIQAMRAGAARIGAGDLGLRLDIRTGDELEELADQFNDMTGRLQESYAGLERKVADRTRELSEALEQQTATSEVLGVISSSSGELAPVFESLLDNALRICTAEFGLLLLSEGEGFRPTGMRGLEGNYVAVMSRFAGRPGPLTAVGQLAATRRTVHFPDLTATAAYKERDPLMLASVEEGHRALLAVPMAKETALLGAIVIYRKEARPFTDKEIALVENFAAQAVIAIENARLLAELRARTDELARSVDELKALGEVTQTVNSTLELQTVLTTIVAKAVEISATDAGAIYVFDEDTQNFRLRATHGMDAALIRAIEAHRIDGGMPTAIVDATARRAPAAVADLRSEPANPVTDIILEAGFRSLLVMPLLRPDRIVGALVVRRRVPGEFAAATVELLQTFAAQSVIAIQNARLFQEIEEKGRELAVASQHKSQFLANMSHELRTPLNAILGYTELILDDIYGAAPQKMRDVLERVQTNGKHLLGLINDVLDLSKIEAGQLTLALSEYSLKELVEGVYVAVEPLATAKNLALRLSIAPNLPRARGDERRLSQVLLNLVGNALKFTDAGEVEISAAAADGVATIAVRDTGPGIAPADQAKIFEEFQQADNSSTRAKGGTGLGLAISRRIVALHGGRLWVESAPGLGSTFSFTLPVTVDRQVVNA
jgi:signal transduction histidine kinase